MRDFLHTSVPINGSLSIGHLGSFLLQKKVSNYITPGQTYQSSFSVLHIILESNNNDNIHSYNKEIKQGSNTLILI